MTTGEINYLLNDSRMSNPLFRFRARNTLIDKFNLTKEEADKLVPKIKGNRFKTGITKTIMEQALEIDDIDKAIEFIKNETGSTNTAMNYISMYKKALKDKGIDITKIDDSNVRKEIQLDANEKLINRREEKLAVDEFFIHPNFSYDNVVNRLAIYEIEEDNKKLNNMQFVADMIVAFSARPGELYNLRFVGDKITGHSKSRDNIPLKYAGMYVIPVAKKMLTKLPKDLDLREDKNITKLSRFMKNYNMQPRALRTIGADYTTRSYIPQERRKIRQLALRHKKLSTSLESYQMPINIK